MPLFVELGESNPSAVRSVVEGQRPITPAQVAFSSIRQLPLLTGNGLCLPPRPPSEEYRGADRRTEARRLIWRDVRNCRGSRRSSFARFCERSLLSTEVRIPRRSAREGARTPALCAVIEMIASAFSDSVPRALCAGTGASSVRNREFPRERRLRALNDAISCR